MNTSLLLLLRRPIAFHPILAEIGGSINAGLFLSQAFYWDQRTNDTEGWFYKTRDEWREETMLTRREQEGARSNLRKRGLIEEKRKGQPARLWFRLCSEDIIDAISSRAETAQLDGRFPPIKKVQNSPTERAETAHLLKTEITSEITHKETMCVFDQFWKEYPVKKGKRTAAAAWKRLKLDQHATVVIASIQNHVKYDEAWRKGFVPYPTTYINQGRWEDVLTAIVAKTPEVCEHSQGKIPNGYDEAGVVLWICLSCHSEVAG